MISDGRTREGERKKKDKIEKIKKLALESRIRIYALGISRATEDGFEDLVGTAAPNGVSKTFSGPKDKTNAELKDYLLDIPSQLNKQYVLDVTAPGLPSDKKVKVKVEVKTPDDGDQTGTYYQEVQFPETPTDWWGIIKIILWILAGITGFILLIWIIKKFINWIRNRKPREKVVVETEVEYIGGEKGRLRVIAGPMAGEEYYLHGDVTTIGSIEGNDVVIPDEGVSKRHAGIRIEEMRYELADFGSTNGTLVNGRTINRLFLKDGDTIRIGNTEMIFTLK